MYHIFVDRYRRGSKAQLPEMPYRKIHKSWNEQPVIGPAEDGLWNVDFYGGRGWILFSTIESSTGAFSQIFPAEGCTKNLEFVSNPPL